MMLKGAIYENLIADMLTKAGRPLYYYRKESGLELDFLIQKANKSVAIEVKTKNGKRKSIDTVLKQIILNFWYFPTKISYFYKSIIKITTRMKRITLSLLSLLMTIGMIALNSCKEEEKEPELTDPIFSIEMIDEDPITVKAILQNDGGHTFTQSGFCWSSSEQKPEIGKCDASKEATLEDKSFTYEFEIMDAGTELYVRAYVKNTEDQTFYSTTAIKVGQKSKMEFGSEDTFRISNEAQRIEIPFTSNCEFAVTIPEEAYWIHVAEGTKGMDSRKAVLDVGPNDDVDGRSAEIVISSKDNTVSKTFTIEQAQKDMIQVNQSSFSINYNQQDIEVLVQHNVDFEIEIDTDWIHETSTRAFAEDVLTFSIDQNTTGTDREGFITLTSEDGKLTEEIIVKQINDQIDIPDPVFLQYLLDYHDENRDGCINISEAQNITEIGISSSHYEKIASLKGIEQMPELQSIYVGGIYTQIAEVDVSHNPKLTLLNIEGAQLTGIDLSHNPELKTLCLSYNKITSVDVSALQKLEKIDVSKNQLTELDLSHNGNLESLDFSENKITSIDVSHLTELTYFYAYWGELTTLDISNNRKLTYFEVRANRLTTIYVWKGFDKTEEDNFYKDSDAQYVEK